MKTNKHKKTSFVRYQEKESIITRDIIITNIFVAIWLVPLYKITSA